MTNNVPFDIDFVVLWVNGQDKKWQNKRFKYSDKKRDDNNPVRFRDYGTFQYWFRAVEMYAPWVHKIYLVTDDQVPSWLNKNNGLIEVIDHKKILPHDALPTFNSNAIELNINKIPNLAEHFVCFNDDMYLNKKVKPTDFFSKTGLPKDCAVQNAIMPIEDFDHMTANNIAIINQNFKKYTVLKKNLFKFFNLKYGYLNLLSVFLLPWPRFTRFWDPHIPISLRKSVFDKVVDDNKEMVKTTSFDRFRSKKDNTIWIIRYYQLVTGAFKPRSPFIGKKYNIKELEEIEKDIRKETHKMICVNDQAVNNIKFEKLTEKLQDAFKSKFPKKSKFEI